MSSRTSKASASAAGQAALAFPILIRMPDLRAGETSSHAASAIPPASKLEPLLPPVETPAATTTVIEGPSQSCTLAMTAAEICPPSQPAAEPRSERSSDPMTKQDRGEPGTPSLIEEVPADRSSTVEVAADPTPEPQVVEASRGPEIAAPAPEAAAVMAEAVPSSETQISNPTAEENLHRPKSIDATSVVPSEDVSPAAARRQRALERARKQTAPAAAPRTWRSSHLPVIAVGFLLALIITVYIARSNRDTRSAQASPEVDIPMLDIDMGNSTDSPAASNSSPAMLAAEPSQPAAGTPELKPLSKSPPLLSATAPADRANPTSSADAHATAKPVNADERVGMTNEHFNARSTSEAVSHESNPSTASELATEADYPSTPPDVHRPGGRVPRTARTLTYPQTSTPNLR